MKKRILSIDFDYFIDTDIDTRNNKFPDGVDEKPVDQLEGDWLVMYAKYPELQDIGVIPEFNECLKYLSTVDITKTCVAESHKVISSLFSVINSEDTLEVVNIDFHHDNYISGGSKIDCANWVRHLMNERPNTEFLWCRREDSEIVSLEGEFPYANTTDFKIEGEFDHIFICFSPEWTPPHLRMYYRDMENLVIRPTL